MGRRHRCTDYLPGGWQEVCIAAGWGGVENLRSKFTKDVFPGTGYTFALDAKKVMPHYAKVEQSVLINLDLMQSRKN
jgi:hypothetical protein